LHFANLLRFAKLLGTQGESNQGLIGIEQKLYPLD
jgi:hypothetical protein